MITECPLVTPCQSADCVETEIRRWFATEVRPLESVLRGYLQSRFQGIYDLDDLVQEALLKLIVAKRRGRVRHTKAMLFTIAKNDAISIIRRQKVSRIIDIPSAKAHEIPEEGPGVLEMLDYKHEVALLKEAIGTLPPMCGQVLRMRRIDGLSTREIAVQLGISESTVQAHVCKGIQRCFDFVMERMGKHDRPMRDWQRYPQAKQHTSDRALP
jgi:RNA polymerase sigma factor (sigma-70 family)